MISEFHPPSRPHGSRWSHPIRITLAVLLCAAFVTGASPAHGQVIEPIAEVQADPAEPDSFDVSVPDVPTVEVAIEDTTDTLSQSVVLIMVMTIGSLLPALMVLMTSFTRFIIVFSLTRNAVGLQNVPPATVLIGLSVFLTLFVMKPVLTTVNDEALQPLLGGELSASEAFDAAYTPLQEFMLLQTRDADLRLFMDMADGPQPQNPEDVPASTLIPAFVVSEVRTAFVIGFLIFVPFLIIDLIVAAVTMSLGMVMLPPVFISLPVKLLVFVLVDGWVLIIGSLVQSVASVG